MTAIIASPMMSAVRARDRLAAPENAADERDNPKRKKRERSVEGGDERKSVLVRVVPALDGWDQAPAPYRQHDHGAEKEGGTQLGRRNNVGPIHGRPPRRCGPNLYP